MNLKIATDKDAEEWNKLVESSPYGTIFHTWNWLKIVEKHTKSKLYPLIGMKGTTPIGVFPLFYQKKKFVKLVFSPPSRALLLYLGPLVVDYDKLKQSKRESILWELYREVHNFSKSELNYNFLRIRSPPGMIDGRVFRWDGYDTKPLYTYFISLRKGSDFVWDGFESQLRKDIRKTQREGVIIEQGSKEDLEFLRTSLARRFTEQGMKPSDYTGYLLDIYDSFYPENFKIFVARYNGKRVGGLTLLCYTNKASLWMGIPKTTLKGIYPNDLVVWESIKWACENGYKQYEIMGAGDDPRLRHFKSKFNPELSIWYSAEKYSSQIYKVFESSFRVYQSIQS